jgi:hypothetical protein
MDLHLGKQKFIESWGRLAGGWGVPAGYGTVARAAADFSGTTHR